MSTRQVRRLKEQLARATLASASEPTDEGDDAASEESGEETVSTARPFNPYLLLLAGDDHDHDEDNDDNEDEDDSNDNHYDSTTTNEHEDPSPTTTTSTTSTTKKKKNRSRKKKPDPVIVATSTATPPSKHKDDNDDNDDEDEDIDAILRELDGLSASTSAASTSASTSTFAPLPPATAKAIDDWLAASTLWSIETRSLRPDEELKRIFGGKVVSAVAREARRAAIGLGAFHGGPGGGNRGRGGGRGVTGRGRDGVPVSLRSSSSSSSSKVSTPKLVVRQDRWPPLPPPSLGRTHAMEGLVRDPRDDPYPPGVRATHYYPGGVPEGFTFVHETGYYQYQEWFEAAVASMDPHSFLPLLRQYPYHADALLQVSAVNRAHGHGDEAEEMLVMALHGLEVAAHRRFDPVGGKSRLSGRCAENRPFFDALFQWTLSLSRRGCHRTALEMAKVIFSLDRSDPLGVLLCVDYLALRAQEMKWLIEVARVGVPVDDLHLTLPPGCQRRPPSVEAVNHWPNFAFSTAMAKCLVEGDEAEEMEKTNDRAWWRRDGMGSGHEHLTWACMLHPSVVRRLVRKLKTAGACGGGRWDDLWRLPLYDEEGIRAGYGNGNGDERAGAQNQNRGLARMSELYVERCHPLWKPEMAQEWLYRAARAAGEKGAVVAGLSATDWAAVRGEMFPVGEEEDDLGHLDVLDFTEAQPFLPDDDAHGG